MLLVFILLTLVKVYLKRFVMIMTKIEERKAHSNLNEIERFSQEGAQIHSLFSKETNEKENIKLDISSRISSLRKAG